MEIDRVELGDLAQPIKIADEIHRQVGECPLPIPVEEIARAVGIIEIRAFETDGFEGGLITNAEKSEGTILINCSSGFRRRRFTVGHEMGHYLNPWHKPKTGDRFLCTATDMRRAQSNAGDSALRMEVEANEFSAELLMPRPRFQRDMRRCAGADLDHVIDLHEKYGISKEAAARRYVQLHDEPCAVVFIKDGRVRYPYRNRDFPFLDVSTNAVLPPQSLSASYDAPEGARFSFQVQHRYAPELRWEHTMISSTLMSVTSFTGFMKPVKPSVRLAA